MDSHLRRKGEQSRKVRNAQIVGDDAPTAVRRHVDEPNFARLRWMANEWNGCSSPHYTVGPKAPLLLWADGGQSKGALQQQVVAECSLPRPEGSRWHARLARVRMRAIRRASAANALGNGKN